MLFTKIVLQASETEQSIKHAVLAIAALEIASSKLTKPAFVSQLAPRLAVNRKPREVERNASGHQIFPLRQYGKAIEKMNAAALTNKCSLKTALLNSLLIICFESFQGDHGSAWRQSTIVVKLREEGTLGSELGTKFPQPSTNCTLTEVLEDEVLGAADHVRFRKWT